MSKLDLKKKKFRFPKGLSGSDGIFFLFGKKVDRSVFWGEIYRRLP